MMPTDRQTLIALTGGIGSGKSVVARMVAAMGHTVYDCDSRARALMESEAIVRELEAEFGAGIFDSGGRLLRRELASIVFSDPAKLGRLNAITHGAVRDDILCRAGCGSHDGPLFIETAILYQSGIDRMVDKVWQVTAPVALRISRVCSRSGLTPSEVMARIEAQDSFVPKRLHPDVSVIVNDGVSPVLPRVTGLLSSIT